MKDGASRKHVSKTLYLDAQGAAAMDYLREHMASQAGGRFSPVALFRFMLDELTRDLDCILKVERHAARRDDSGRFISVSLSPKDREQLAMLEEHYLAHAPRRTRVRDGAPKSKSLPISRLFCEYIRKHAKECGWQDEG